MAQSEYHKIRLKLARELLAINALDTALGALIQIEEHAQWNENSSKDVFDVLILIASTYAALGQHDKAHDYCNNIENRLHDHPHDETYRDALFAIAKCHFDREKYVSTLATFKSFARIDNFKKDVVKPLLDTLMEEKTFVEISSTAFCQNTYDADYCFLNNVAQAKTYLATLKRNYDYKVENYLLCLCNLENAIELDKSLVISLLKPFLSQFFFKFKMPANTNTIPSITGPEELKEVAAQETQTRNPNHLLSVPAIVTAPTDHITIHLQDDKNSSNSARGALVSFTDEAQSVIFFQRIINQIILELELIDLNEISKYLVTHYPNSTPDTLYIRFELTDKAIQENFSYDNLIRVGLGENVRLKSEEQGAESSVKSHFQAQAKLVIEKSNTKTHFNLNPFLPSENFKLFQDALYAQLRKNPAALNSINIQFPINKQDEAAQLKRYHTLSLEGHNPIKAAQTILRAFHHTPKSQKAFLDGLKSESLIALNQKNFGLLSVLSKSMKRLAKNMPVKNTKHNEAPSEQKTITPKR